VSPGPLVLNKPEGVVLQFTRDRRRFPISPSSEWSATSGRSSAVFQISITGAGPGPQDRPELAAYLRDLLALVEGPAGEALFGEVSGG